MFKFLKDKLKKTIASFSKSVDEEAEPVTDIGEVEQDVYEVAKESSKESPKEEPAADEENVPSKEIPEPTIVTDDVATESVPVEAATVSAKSDLPIKEPVKESVSTEISIDQSRVDTSAKTIEPDEIIEDEKKPSFFSKLTSSISKKRLSEQKFEELFWDLEMALLENNVALEVIEKIKQDLKQTLVGQELIRKKINDSVMHSLESSLKGLFVNDAPDLVRAISSKKPYVILFVGINGSGKTTTIAKVAKYLLNNKISPVLAAADTFRAAAIDQLQEHATALGVKLIKQDYGSDPAAVAYDAVQYAKARNKDVVLVDTAGRIHSNVNLMDEMKKIVRVAKPDMILFIGESITGNDCVEQAKQFNSAVNLDGIILSKADIDEKGGAAVSISYVTKKPILFLGVGQNYEDLVVFNPEKVLTNLGLG